MSPPPTSTLWVIDPHTRGKHMVLKNYLDAWLPIMARWNERILFIDGFAGPGEYVNHEDGSPVIAQKAFRDHASRSSMKAKVTFLFVEKDPRRAEHLEAVIRPIVRDLGDQARATVWTGAFDETVINITQYLEEQHRRLAPAFVMADPFGVSDTPMAVIEQILRNPKSEVFITFMWDFIRRLHNTHEFPPHLDGLFGTPQWRQALAHADWHDQKRAVFDLYKRQLKLNGASNVVHFELYEGERLVYAIFHATNHEVGCDRMKRAIWKVAPFDGMAFRPSEEQMVSLFADDRSVLKRQIRQRFGGETWWAIEELMTWTMSDATSFHSGHLKSALRELESGGLLRGRARTGSTRRSKQYPEGTQIQITPF